MSSVGEYYSSSDFDSEDSYSDYHESSTEIIENNRLLNQLWRESFENIATEEKNLNSADTETEVQINLLMSTDAINQNPDDKEKTNDENTNDNIELRFEGNTPILFATQSNNISLINLLLSNGANINSKNSLSGMNSLMYSILNNKLEIIQLLVIYGIDINAVDKSGNSALMLTVEKDNFEAFSILIDAGADLKIFNKTRDNVLSYASGNLNNKFLLKLLQYEELIDMQDNKGQTVLIKSSIAGYCHRVSSLLLHKASMEIKDIYGYTALSWACCNGRFGIVKQLVNNGADINCRSKKNETPILLAIKNDYISIANFLLESRGIDVNVADESRQTCLYFAAMNNNEKLAISLIKNGADKTFQNGKNLSPHEFIKQFKLEDMYKLFDIPAPKIIKEITKLNSNHIKRIHILLIESIKQCPICLDALTIDNSTTTPCIHIICTTCLSKIINKKKECPICRSPL